jgi:hypothetical protein
MSDFDVLQLVLLVVRVSAGVTLALHGYQKLIWRFTIIRAKLMWYQMH